MLSDFPHKDPLILIRKKDSYKPLMEHKLTKLSVYLQWENLGQQSIWKPLRIYLAISLSPCVALPFPTFVP